MRWVSHVDGIIYILCATPTTRDLEINRLLRLNIAEMCQSWSFGAIPSIILIWVGLSFIARHFEGKPR